MTIPICESYLLFSLPDGSRHHEQVNPNDTGVDFEIASKPAVWLEVKNWEAPVIPPDKRSTVDLDFANKTNTTSTFWDALVAKFEGTYDFLHARNELPQDVRLGLLLESRMFSELALAPAISILEARIALSPKVRGRPLGVVNASRLSAMAQGTTAIACSVSPYPHCICNAPITNCSALRRIHSRKATQV